ncbi:MAG: hypothetical protein IPK12_19655 [Gemmatimonadetes bacterium]|nr:hypothetical protein [Gemmatimonadota bacterium]
MADLKPQVGHGRTVPGEKIDDPRLAQRPLEALRRVRLGRCIRAIVEDGIAEER